MRPLLEFRGSPARRRDHFYGLSASRFQEAGLRIAPLEAGPAVSPADKS